MLLPRWLVDIAAVREGHDLVAVPSFPNWRLKQLRDRYHLH
jgi:hypothetical protein